MWMIVVLLGIVIILYASMLPRRPERAPVQEDFLDSVGDTLQHFVDEIEEENKELLQMLSDMKREHETKAMTLTERIEQLEKQVKQPSPGPVVERVVVERAVPAPSMSPAPEPAEQDAERALVILPEAPRQAASGGSRFTSTVKTRYKELFDLHESGKSIEYIAKKLGKNKGEVQLIIGLARQEEPQHGQP